jgi:hypothetical protein
LYLHVFDWPKDAQLVVPGLTNPVVRAFVVGQPDAVTVRPEAGQLMLQLPAQAPHPIASVVAIEIHGRPGIR